MAGIGAIEAGGLTSAESRPAARDDSRQREPRKRPITEKRRNQNREANRLYRERQKHRLRDLERLLHFPWNESDTAAFESLESDPQLTAPTGREQQDLPVSIGNFSEPFSGLDYSVNVPPLPGASEILHDVDLLPELPAPPSNIPLGSGTSWHDGHGFLSMLPEEARNKDQPMFDWQGTDQAPFEGALKRNYLALNDGIGPPGSRSNVGFDPTSMAMLPATPVSPPSPRKDQPNDLQMSRRSTHTPQHEPELEPLRRLFQLEDNEENNLLVKIAIQHKLSLQDIVLAGLKSFQSREPSSTSPSPSYKALPDPYANNFTRTIIPIPEALLMNAKKLHFKLDELYTANNVSPYYRPGLRPEDNIEELIEVLSRGIPPDLRPTAPQILYKHHGYLDLLPLPTFRARAVYFSTRTPPLFKKMDLKMDLVHSGMTCRRTGREGSDNPWNRGAWVPAPWFLKKWRMLLMESGSEVMEWLDN
ncbi:MAG: hypothetical protein M4579_002731 [Chaenotheca gracillima]|nr:MAG: hypothetical protein M4579_002731 [Chaenotheca gracillima]